MNYSIMCGRNDNYVVSLDKSVNAYTVDVRNKRTGRTESRAKFGSFAAALPVFHDTCLDHGIWNPEYVDHNQTTFANVD